MTEPVSRDLAKQNLRLDLAATDEDAVIDNAITAAREWVEGYTGQILTRRAVAEVFDCFSDLRLRTWPVASVQGVTYLDRDGVTRQIAADEVFPAFDSRPARIWPLSGARFPVALARPGSVIVTVMAGYGDGEVPAKFIQAMLVLITSFYVNRDADGFTVEAVAAAKMICGPSSRMWSV